MEIQIVETFKMKRLETQILIIGAGPSGMVAAGYLKKHGVNCLVVEKSNFPRFSIGESYDSRISEKIWR